MVIHIKLFSFVCYICIGDGTRTRTDIPAHWGLNPACLPIPPPRQIWYRERDSNPYATRAQVFKTCMYYQFHHLGILSYIECSRRATEP